MIAPALRVGLLGQFPVGTPVLVIAPVAAGWRELIGERADPATRVSTLDADGTWTPAQPSETSAVIFEGLDDVPRPDGALRALRAAFPQTRLFTLVLNGTGLAALETLLAGSGTMPVRPLVGAELEPLFADAGWSVRERVPIDDPRIAPGAVPPLTVAAGPVELRIADDAMLERVRPTAFVLIADPA